MNGKPLIWDLPTRICHWTFALSLTASLAIGLTVDDGSPLFRLHMLFGLVAVFVLAVRLVLGVVGSRSARFTSFPLGPRSVVSYFRSVVLHETRRPEFAGNNPGSALAAVAMFVLVPLIVLTGIGAGGEAFEDVHAVAAYALLAVIGAHLLGIAVHTITRRENIGAAMVTGRMAAPPAGELRSARPFGGLIVALAIGAWCVALYRGYDAGAGTVRVPLVGATLRLGENEDDEKRSERGAEAGRDHKDRDDDDDD
ncbi:MAG TPA: cytochrome b/b6 domain-containing protein [Opitutaceae bacterium]|nr:cytochrome b/b6 domain-containing protein [Opitutaceae bacterium]